MDIAELQGWIGKSEQRTEELTGGLVERFRATIGHLAPNETESVPPGVHWCLAISAAAASEIGPDGHPSDGHFLPPLKLSQRLWAGSTLRFVEPLQIGDRVRRTSRITDILEKNGRRGRLVFVTVQHEITTDRGIAISERQDIVFAEKRLSNATSNELRVDMPVAEHNLCVDATTTLLFRYSALTFNGHRIHYDRDYACEVEGYPGLLVHGPLQATLLMNLAARIEKGAV